MQLSRDRDGSCRTVLAAAGKRQDRGGLVTCSSAFTPRTLPHDGNSISRDETPGAVTARPNYLAIGIPEGLFGTGPTKAVDPRRPCKPRINLAPFPNPFTSFIKKMAASLHWRPFQVVRNHCLSSGDRIRTCDLWVMSRSVSVLRIPLRPVYAGQQPAAVWIVAPRPHVSRVFRTVSFTNPFTTGGRDSTSRRGPQSWQQSF